MSYPGMGQPSDVSPSMEIVLSAGELSYDQVGCMYCTCRSYDSTLRVWSLSPSPLMDTTYTCLHTLHGHLNRVYSLLLDGKRNLVVSGSLDTTIRIWDISDGKMLHVLIGHTSLTSGMALHGDRQLVSGNADNTVRVWDITDGSCVHVLSRHDAAVTSLTLLSNGLLVTSSDDGSAKLWDVNAGTILIDV